MAYFDQRWAAKSYITATPDGQGFKLVVVDQLRLLVQAVRKRFKVNLNKLIL